MQVVEDMEKRALCLWFVNQILYVIDNQRVYALIEIDELVDFSGSGCNGVLAFKKPGTDIEYTGRRICLPDFDSDCLD